jgi:hypothetical protein
VERLNVLAGDFSDVEWDMQASIVSEASTEITRLRSALATAEEEIERLTEKAIVGEYMWTPVELGEAVATARKETLEEAASLIDSTPAKSNYAIYDHLAAAIRALAEKTGGDKP